MSDLVDYLREKLAACSCQRGNVEGQAGKRVLGLIVRWSEICPVHIDSEALATEQQSLLDWLNAPERRLRWWRR